MCLPKQGRQKRKRQSRKSRDHRDSVGHCCRPLSIQRTELDGLGSAIAARLDQKTNPLADKQMAPFSGHAQTGRQPRHPAVGISAYGLAPNCRPV